MSDKHTVIVEFDHSIAEYETVEQFVKQCMTGNRSNRFARNVTVETIDYRDNE